MCYFMHVNRDGNAVLQITSCRSRSSAFNPQRACSLLMDTTVTAESLQGHCPAPLSLIVGKTLLSFFAVSKT